MLTSIFWLSLASLMFEVVITRYFAISQWNHLAFMVISIALLGFAVSGTALGILQTRHSGLPSIATGPSAPKVLGILYATITTAAYAGLRLIPLDYARLPLEASQALYLLIVYLLLALPFVCAGWGIALGYILQPAQAGRVYLASMAGSACGAFLPVMLLPVLDEGRLLLLSGLLPMIGLGNTGRCWQGEQIGCRPWSPGAVWAVRATGALMAVAVCVPTVGLPTAVSPSPYKALGQMLRLPQHELIASCSTLRGRIDVLASPYIRYAPGLSIKYMSKLPAQRAVYRDGDHPVVLYDLQYQAALNFARATLPYAGYHLFNRPEQVLIGLEGGGSAIACALAGGASNTTVAVRHPILSKLVAGHYGLKVHAGDVRSWLGQVRRTYDIIHLDHWGASLPGSAALHQEAVFTITAFRTYLRHLSPHGILIMARKLLLPPSDMIRMWATAIESLHQEGYADPRRHLAVLRSWDAYTLIVSKQPLSSTGALNTFAQHWNFDWVYCHDLDPSKKNRFNVYETPYHYNLLQQLDRAYRNGTEAEFFQTYFMDVLPQSDDRPYPGRFLKWPRLQEAYESTGQRGYIMMMSGEMVVGVVLLEAVIIGVLLTAVPFFSLPRRAHSAGFGRRMLFFLAVGLGFMAVELWFIKAFNVVLGDPAVSLCVVLSGILIFSAVGGLLSQRLKAGHLGAGLLVLVMLLAGCCLTWDYLLAILMTLSGWRQYVGALILLLPLGVLLGVPFPLGMRCLLPQASDRAFAWAFNGCASVIMAVAAAQIALSQGLVWVGYTAVVGYLAAWLCQRGLAGSGRAD